MFQKPSFPGFFFLSASFNTRLKICLVKHTVPHHLQPQKKTHAPPKGMQRFAALRTTTATTTATTTTTKAVKTSSRRRYLKSSSAAASANTFQTPTRRVSLRFARRKSSLVKTPSTSSTTTKTNTKKIIVAMASSSSPSSQTTTAEFIENFNRDYLQRHKSYEDNFWETKMDLKGNSVENLNTSFNALETFLGDQNTLEKVRELLKRTDGSVSEEQKIVLNQIEKTLKCYIVESDDAKALRESMMKKEGTLQKSRNNLKTQYTDKDGKVVDTTPTVIRTKMRSDPEESVRKSCWEMLRKNGPFLLDNGFCDIIKERNRFARELGFEDFYDLKVTNAEGFSKKKCFEMLDGLEQATKPLLDKALEMLKKEKGEDATKPWNTGFALSGELTKLTDPYYPFEYAPEVWGRSFSKMNIKYKGATMRLDLCDRKGKYPNGFCHWPTAPYKTQDGTFIPSETNFTSLATPDEIGSGNTALTTLMHEGGHAAHFSNIVQGSPLFSQERAPFSVALAETQSMFLDALCEDASWQARYAKNRKGETIPWELIERSIKERHPYKVFQLRGMIAVPYFEKALYEMDEKDLTPENVLKVADEVEMKIQGGLAGRPLMSVPHILADESSCYYHGYVFAEMAVHQTREYFFKTGDGTIVDNPRVGKELIENYWVHGSGNPGFLGLVNNLTGSPLKHDAWVKELGVEVADMLKEEKAEYEKALASASSSSKDEIDLEMRAIFVHGDDVISDSNDSSFTDACEKFRGWIYQEWPKTKTMA